MAYKSLYTGQQIDDAIGVVIEKESIWDVKQDKIAGSHGQVVGFDENGTPVAQDAPDTGVVLFNGRAGKVAPQPGDYTAEMVGALPAETFIPSKISELENDSGFLTGTDADAKVAALVNSAPETLNTLGELAQALGDDPNFATSVATQIGNKVDKIDGKQLSTNDFTDEYKSRVDSALQSYVETDPTVPAWAKATKKPEYSASELIYDSSTTGMSASDVQSAVDELFTFVSDGKSGVASAITDMGVDTADDATFAAMAENIRKIEISVIPIIDVGTNGLITATSGDKSATHQLITQAATTITPGTSNKIAVSENVYTTGAVTVAGSSNLVAGNIKSGVNLFGVTGTYSGSAQRSYTMTGAGTGSYTGQFVGDPSILASICSGGAGTYAVSVTLNGFPSSAGQTDWDAYSMYVSYMNGSWQALGTIYHMGTTQLGACGMNTGPYMSGSTFYIPAYNSYNGARFFSGATYVCTVFKL